MHTIDDTSHLARFYGTSSNSSTGLIYGYVVFGDGSINTGVVDRAVFYGTAVNSGTVTISAVFNDDTSNVGVISGDAVFADYSSCGPSAVIGGVAYVNPLASISEGSSITARISYVQPSEYILGYEILRANRLKSINSDVDVSNLQLSTLPFEFIGVIGNFDCHGNNLTTLHGSPSSVTGNFDCNSNPLSTLNGAPAIINGIFDCTNTPLITATQGIITIGGGWYNFANSTSVKLSAGYVLSETTNYITINSVQFNNGVYQNVFDGYGNINDNYIYKPLGYELYDDTMIYHYVSDGIGGYTEYYRNSYVITTSAYYITINSSLYPNGTVDVIANGSGGAAFGNYQYAVSGFEIYNDQQTYKYISDGVGGYIQIELNPTPYVVSTNTYFVNISSVNYPAGTYDLLSDNTTTNYQYLSAGSEIYDDLVAYHHLSNGLGGYVTYFRYGYVLFTNVVNYVTIDDINHVNGTYDVISNGLGETLTTNPQYLSEGSEIYDDGSVFHYVSDGDGGYTQYYRNTYVISTSTFYVNIDSIDHPNGTYDVIADGSGGAANDNYQYTQPGTEIYDDGSVYHYVSDGTGSVTQYYRNTYVISTNTFYVNIDYIDHPNGTYDVIADGSGGTTNGNYQYAQPGTELYDDGAIYHYVSNGSGGYDQYYRLGYLIPNQNAYTTISEANNHSALNGLEDATADGSGGFTYSNRSYAVNGTVLYDDGSTYHYVSNGSGGYTQYYRTGYLIQDDSANSISINDTDYPNGTFDEVADGSGSSTFIYTYAIIGTEFYAANGISYQSNGNGGYTEVSTSSWYDDSSLVAHTVAVNGTVTQSDEGGGVIAALFDGSSGWFVVDSFNFNLTQDSTIEFWMKPTQNGQNTILGNQINNTIGQLNVGIVNNNLFFTNNAITDVGGAFAPNFGEWQHVAIVTQSGVKKIYQNGTLKSTNTQQFNDLTSLKIGYIGYGYYSGKLAGLRLVAGTAIYTSNFEVPTTLPTDVSGTELLLNFGATAVPDVLNWYEDTSSAARTVTLNGTVTQSDEGSGVIAALLDGSLDYLSTSNINFGDNQFTIEGFFKPNSLNQMSVLFGSSNGPYNQPKLVAYVYNGNLKVELINESTQSSLEAPLSNIKLNEWNHIALIRDGGYNALYINGVHVDNAPFQSTTGITAPFYVGWAGEIDSFDGLIAGFRVVVGTALYGGATLTIPTTLPTDVSGTELLLNFGATAAPTVTVSYWFNDTSSLSHVLIPNGTITQSDEGSGILAAALGSDGYLTTTLNDDFGTGDFTIEGFINNSSYSSNTYLIDARLGSNWAIGWALDGSNSGALTFYDGNTLTFITSDTLVPSSQWSHIAVVRNSNVLAIYLNGVNVGQANNSTDFNGTGTLTIGRRYEDLSNSYFNGSIAGLRIVKGTALYTSNFAVPTSIPTDVTGTTLLLNFEATAVPIVAPVVISDPQDVVDADLHGVFSIIATGTNLEYQWQASADNGATWSDLDNIQNGSNTNTWNEQGQPLNDQLFRCKVSNSAGTVYSNTARISRVDWYDDTSSTPNIVTLNGTVTQSNEGGGVLAAGFDGAGYITLDSNTEYDLTGDFTVELFGKLSSTGQNTFVSNGIGVAGWQIRQIEDGTNNLMFYRYDGSTEEYYRFSHTLPSDNTWHHIAVARQGTTLKLFVNGIMTNSHETSTQFARINDSTPLVLGRGEYYSAGTFINLHGSIAGLRVVRDTALYTSNFTIPTTLPTNVTGTVLLLNFGATAAPTVTPASNWYDDTSSAARTVYNNGVTQEDEGNGVLVADFNNSFLSVDNPMSLATGDFTLEYFIKYDSAGIGYQPGVAIYTPNIGDYNATINSYIEAANYFNVLMTNSAGTGWQTYVPGDDAGTKVTPVANQWFHIAATRSGDTLALYLNGNLLGTRAISDTTIYDVNRVLEIGRYTAFPGGSLSLYGRIAGLRIVKGTALYSGSTYTIPTSLPTAVNGTELLLNFGATAAPRVPNWYDDSSSAAHSVTLNGTVTQSDEGGGVKAAEFNSGYFTLNTPSLGTFGGDFTLEMFVKPTDNSTYRSIITLGNYDTGILLRNSSNGAVDNLYIAGSPQTYYISNNNYLLQNIWNHIAIVKSSQYVRVYANGLTVAEFVHGTGLNFSNISIGNAVHNTSEILQGKITGIRLVLGTGLYSGSTITVPTTLPTAVNGTELLLNFGATAAPTSNWYDDTSSTPSTNTLTGTVTQSDEGGGVLTALVGANSQITYTATDVGTGKQDSTVEFFINFRTLNNNEYGIPFSILGGGGAYTLVYGTNVYASSVTYPILRLTSSFQGMNVDGFRLYINNWYHVAVVRQNEVFKIYINGTHYPFVTQNGGGDFTGATWDLASTTDTVIGNSTLTNNYKITGFRAIKGVALYTSDFTPPTTLPTAVANTELLLNFGATAAPIVNTTTTSNWYDDSSYYVRNVVNDGSTQFDEGGGVKGAELSNLKSINTGTNGDFAGNDFTVEYFIKLNSGPYGFPIGNIYQGGGPETWALGHPTDGSVYLSSTTQGHGQYGAGVVTLGHWSHIALTRTNGVVELYVNGVKAHVYTSAPTFTANATIVINPAIWAGYHVDGKIAMVRVSNVARYSGSTYTVPSSVFSSDGNTLLLLNFGATAAPSITGLTWAGNIDCAGNSILAFTPPGYSLTTGTVLYRNSGLADLYSHSTFAYNGTLYGISNGQITTISDCDPYN